MSIVNSWYISIKHILGDCFFTPFANNYKHFKFLKKEKKRKTNILRARLYAISTPTHVEIPKLHKSQTYNSQNSINPKVSYIVNLISIMKSFFSKSVSPSRRRRCIGFQEVTKLSIMLFEKLYGPLEPKQILKEGFMIVEIIV